MYFEYDELSILLKLSTLQRELPCTSSLTLAGQRCIKSMTDVAERVSALEKKIIMMESLFITNPVSRVKFSLIRRGIKSAIFQTVPDNYYSMSFVDRATLLKCSVPQLCKSIILENTSYCDEYGSDMTYSRYYCLVLQYAAKFNEDKIIDFCQKIGMKNIPRKRYSFQLAPSDVSAALTGFDHNAVSPYGLFSSITILVDKACLSVSPAFIWLGGGAVNVKLGIAVRDLLRSTGAFVGETSDPRQL